MEVFESRCFQICRARNQNYSKKKEAIDELLRIRRQYPQKREDGSPHPEYTRKSEEIAFLKKDIGLLNSSEDKTTVPHPLIPKKNGKIIRRRHEDKITKVWKDQRVWYEPYHKADASFEQGILSKPTKQIEMIRGREFHWRQELGSAPFPLIFSFYGSFFLNSLTNPLILSGLLMRVHSLTLFPARNSQTNLSFHFSFLNSWDFLPKTLSITLNYGFKEGFFQNT